MSIIAAVRQYRLISLRITSYQFNPGILSTVVTVAFLYIMMSLGFWQLDRAEFKDTLQQKITERKSLSTSGIDKLPQSTDERRYLPVKITGQYDFEHNFLLDNKTFNGRVGYHVFTPVKITGTRAVLISRGFINLGKSRDQLPVIETPESEINIQGILDLQPSRALVLAENVNQTEHWPLVLQYLDLEEVSQTLGYELYDMVLWLNEKEPGSFEYDLPVLNLNAAKNNGYAFQWFAMSLALFIIYIVVNTKKIN
ncbi:Cytochrome oxidase biogenesis protein Surf1, facilitates heme A insertion [hydrothermal vent metagenome]|uniref:Cytochrome oxidase biogenesis protein Surf1, facilitates heme A insertion n=1 Tax=hydrothermal vent metagenome TaxID=652676 RepID=A0A3B0WHC4_9ZZZZ